MTRANHPPSRPERTATMEQRLEARCEVLWLVKGRSGTRQVQPDKPVRVGRGADCDVRIEDASVSRAHAVLHPGEPWEVEDLGSHNGTRVAGLRLGAGDRAPMPEGVAVSIGEALIVLHRPPHPDHDSAQVSGPGDGMKEVERVVALAAKSDISIILVGETGVGKEVMAGQIHRASSRGAKPLVALNCAALPDNLLESELFGHERGAFTGAVTAKQGLLETAAGGTVFLDEIGDLTLATQPKLLRALETRQVLPIGALKPRPFDARFIAATHRSLERMVKRGEFRSDLYYRLNGITIAIPPLRARLAELEPLAKHFVVEACQRLGSRPVVLSKAALASLRAHPWPGNIRELRNVIERAVVLSEGDTIQPRHISLRDGIGSADDAPPFALEPPPAGKTTASQPGLMDELVEVERKRILEAMDLAGGNQTVAARLLQISRRTLVYRLGQLDLRPHRRTR